MKKKIIIISSVIIATIVCVIFVLLVIRNSQARNIIKDGKLPVISDEGVRDDISADSIENEPEHVDGQKQDELTTFTNDVDPISDPVQDDTNEAHNDETAGEENQETSDETPLDNNETPFIMG